MQRVALLRRTGDPRLLACGTDGPRLCSAPLLALRSGPGTRQTDFGHPCALNKTSIKPAVYGEPFVKRHGLFSMTVASRHGVVSSCVSRQDHDRSAVHQLDTDRSGRRAGRGNAVAGAGLVDFRSHPRTIAPPPKARCLMLLDDASPLVRQAMARGVRAQRRGARRHRAGAVARPGLGRAAGARTFTASDRCRSRRHRRDRQQRDAMRHRPPHQSAGLGLRRDRRSRHALPRRSS